ncbi:MAG: DUF6263 family protein [Phycisphaerae bacterium]|nr:DUF6263 family protein [Phycisphaerae bacterium]
MRNRDLHLRHLPLILAALIATAPGSSTRAEDLRPIWKKGRTSRYQVTQTEVTTLEVRGMTQPRQTLMDMELKVAWEILEADADGGGTARMTFSDLALVMTGVNGDKSRATAEAADEKLAGARTWIQAMSDTPLRVTVDADGSISKVRGFEAIRRKAGEQGDRLDENYFKEIAMDLAVLFGGTENREAGDSWKLAHGAAHRMGQISYDSTYEMQGVENIAGIPVAMVNRNSKMSFEPRLPDDLPADAPEVDVRVSESDHRAQIMFDTSRREVVGSNMSQTLELEIRRQVLDRELVTVMREESNTQMLRIQED